MHKPRTPGHLPVGLVALRERNFLLYAAGQFTSQLGSWIEVTAVSWIIYEMTNSPLLLGLNALFRAVPMMVLALFGGAIADRVPRRLLLLTTESTMLCASLVMGLLAATGQLQYWHLYVLNFVSGSLSAFSVPARHALFGGLVPRSSLQSAVTLNAVAVRSAGFIGPSIAGLALAFAGYALPFFLNGVSFLGMLLALVAMRLPAAQADAMARRPGLRHGMTEGLDFVWRTPLLKIALGFEIASGLFGHNSTLITIIARDVLAAGPQGLGLLLSATGAGALLAMAMMLTFEIKQHGRVILMVGSIYAVLWAAFGVSHWLWLSVLLLFTLGTTDSVWGVTRNTIAQLSVPDALRGRVMSVVMLATRGSSQLGRVQSGVLVDLMGAPLAVLVGAAVIGGTVLAALRVRLPRLSAIPVEPAADRDEAL